MRYTVRKADTKIEADRIALLKLHAETFPWDDVPRLDDTTWWLAYAGSKPVGFAGLTESDYEDDTGYLIRAGVTKAHRGRGLQKRFLRLRESEARRLGYHALVSDTVTSNVPCLRNLILAEFQPFWPSEPWARNDSSYWRKPLRPH